MAQDSAMHQGATTGHAASTDIWAAPYSADEYANIYSKLLASDIAIAYVIPGYANNLKIQANSPAAMNVIVKSGAALFRGRIYENTTDETITIAAADATNPRIDRVVLRHDIAAQTILLAVVTGTPAATPSLPALTQNASTYELELGYVWVAALTASIADAEVHDMRQFMITPELMFKALHQPNMIINSEFMARSTASGSGGVTENYTLVGTVTFTDATKPAQMSRGRAIAMTAGTALDGHQQTVLCKASTLYSFKCLMNVTAGDVGRITITTNSGAPQTITRNIRRTGTFIEEIIYFTTEADASSITVAWLGVNATDIITVGQSLLVEGYTAGPYREIHETIFFINSLSDSNWQTDAKSTGTTTITLTIDYGARILLGTRAVYFTLEANDSGSAAASAVFLAIMPVTSGTSYASRLDLNGLPNDKIHSATGIVTLNDLVRFVIDVSASGVGTLDATVRILGIVV